MTFIHFPWKVEYHRRNEDATLMAIDNAVCDFVDNLPFGDVLAHRVHGGLDIYFQKEEDAVTFKLKFGV